MASTISHAHDLADRSGAACGRRARARSHRSERAARLQRLTQLVAEVLVGQRDPAQLRGVMSTRAHAALVRRAGAYRSAASPRVRIVLSCPEPGVGEVGAVVDCGGRCRALALRVSFAGAVLQCTHLETDVRH